MKTRGVAVLVAMMLAVAATLAIYLYVQGVRRSATTTTSTMVTVIVPKGDIAAGTKLDSVLSSGGFTTLRVPSNVVVQGAVTDGSQLKGQTTKYPILQGEQITIARLQGSSLQLKGGVLGIPSGYEAITLPMDQPEAVGGVLQAGDHVTIYASFDDISIITGDLKKIVQGTADTKKVDIGGMTVAMVPDAQILRVVLPSAGGALNPNNNQTVHITFALTPQDAENVVDANSAGSVWLGLLPPDQRGEPLPPSSIVNLLTGSTRRLPV